MIQRYRMKEHSRRSRTLAIRRATLADIFYVRQTIKKEDLGNCAPVFYFRWVIKQGIALVIEYKQQRVGFLIGEINTDIAYAQLVYLFVHPRFRRKTLGTALLKKFLLACRQKGVKYIDLHTKIDATKFYQKFGFKAEGKFITMYKKI